MDAFGNEYHLLLAELVSVCVIYQVLNAVSDGVFKANL